MFVAESAENFQCLVPGFKMLRERKKLRLSAGEKNGTVVSTDYV